MNKNKCKTIAETKRKIASEKCKKCPLDYWKAWSKNGGQWCPKWLGSVCALFGRRNGGAQKWGTRQDV